MAGAKLDLLVWNVGYRCVLDSLSAQAPQAEASACGVGVENLVGRDGGKTEPAMTGLIEIGKNLGQRHSSNAFASLTQLYVTFWYERSAFLATGSCLEEKARQGFTSVELRG